MTKGLSMELDTSTLMLIFFILFLTASIWKIWAFLPNKQLSDDDTTKESQEILTRCMINAIKKSDGEITLQELLVAMREEKDFDTKIFWRFNLNKLKHLLQSYYALNPEISTIMEIYKK